MARRKSSVSVASPYVDLLSCDACVADSPSYRTKLKQCEAEVLRVESKISKVVKTCNEMVEQSTKYGASINVFLDSLHELGNDDSDSASGPVTPLQHSIQRFVDVLKDFESQRELLVMQAKMTVADRLSDWSSNDIKSCKEMGKVFGKLSDDADKCRSTYAAVPKNKISEHADAKNMLVATDYSFLHTSLDYAYKFNVLLNQKDSLLCESVLAFIHSQNMFYMQGSDSIRDLDPNMKSTAVIISTTSRELDRRKRIMEARHGEAQMKATKEQENLGCSEHSIAAGMIKSGYLFRRETNTFRSWTRRYISVRNGAVYASIRSSKNDVGEEVYISDLRLATPKATTSDVSDRSFCFELVTPFGNHKLQALSLMHRDLWIAGIQDEIEIALNKGKEGSAGSASRVTSNASGSSAELIQSDHHDAEHENMSSIMEIAGNTQCADCGGRPTWCSINLGITLCIECSGIHRSMGVHVSKVRSLVLDKMSPGISAVMAAIGNDASNEFYHALLGSEQAKLEQPGPRASRDIRESWIKKKYIERAFVLPEDRDEVNKQLCEAATSGLFRECVRCIISGAEVNSVVKVEDKEILPLVEAVIGKSQIIAEYLLLNQADVNIACGEKKRSALHYAAEAADVELVHLLLRNKANISTNDADGNDALKLAIDSASADTATLLRLAALEREEGGAGPEDEWIGIKMDDFTKKE